MFDSWWAFILLVAITKQWKAGKHQWSHLPTMGKKKIDSMSPGDSVEESHKNEALLHASDCLVKQTNYTVPRRKLSDRKWFQTAFQSIWLIMYDSVIAVSILEQTKKEKEDQE